MCVTKNPKLINNLYTTDISEMTSYSWEWWYLGPICSTRSVWLTPPLVWGCPAHVYTTEEDWGEDEETALLLETRTTWWHKNLVKTFQSGLLQTFVIVFSFFPESTIIRYCRFPMDLIINLIIFVLVQLIKR